MPTESNTERQHPAEAREDSLNDLERKAMEALPRRSNERESKPETVRRSSNAKKGILLHTTDAPGADEQGEEILKKAGTPSAQLEKRAETLNKPIQQYAKALLTADERGAFLPEDANTGMRKFSKAVLTRIDGILKQIVTDGLVTAHFGKISNRTTYAVTWLQELDPLSKDPLLTADQKKYIEKIRELLTATLRGDPQNARRSEVVSRKVETSYAVKQGKGAARFLALLGAAGLALFSSGIDLFTGKSLSYYSIFWLGTTAAVAGLFRGRERVIREQVAPFTTQKSGRSLLAKLNRVNEDERSEIIRTILALNTSKDPVTKKMFNLESYRRPNGSFDREGLIKRITQKAPEGPTAKFLKSLSDAELLEAITFIPQVKDKSAQGVLQFLIAHQQEMDPKRLLDGAEAIAKIDTPSRNAASA